MSQCREDEKERVEEEKMIRHNKICHDRTKNRVDKRKARIATPQKGNQERRKNQEEGEDSTLSFTKEQDAVKKQFKTIANYIQRKRYTRSRSGVDTRGSLPSMDN